MSAPGWGWQDFSYYSVYFPRKGQLWLTLHYQAAYGTISCHCKTQPNFWLKRKRAFRRALKVNSALDDPSAFFTASSLNARAGDLTRLLDRVGLAIQTLDAADEGIQALTSLLEATEATVRSAQEATGNNATETGTVTGIVATDTLDGLGFADGETFSVQSGTATATTYTAVTAATATVQDLLDGINADANVTASLNSAGAIVIEETSGGIDLTIGGTATTASIGFAGGATSAAANTERSTAASQFDALLTQIDQLAGDASFNGTNLLDGDSLTVVFNEDNTSSITIAGVTFDSAGLGISASANTFQDDASIATALTQIGTAIDTLRSQASTFGSNLSVVEIRQDFTKELINTLESGAAGLTLADSNEEGANLLALQTRQQLSTVALSLASQADQNVLRLF